jgi:hypothetical protein
MWLLCRECVGNGGLNLVTLVCDVVQLPPVSSLLRFGRRPGEFRSGIVHVGPGIKHGTALPGSQGEQSMMFRKVIGLVGKFLLLSLQFFFLRSVAEAISCPKDTHPFRWNKCRQCPSAWPWLPSSIRPVRASRLSIALERLAACPGARPGGRRNHGSHAAKRNASVRRRPGVSGRAPRSACWRRRSSHWRSSLRWRCRSWGGSSVKRLTPTPTGRKCRSASGHGDSP